MLFMSDFSRIAEFESPQSLQKRFNSTKARIGKSVSNLSNPRSKKRTLTDNVIGTTATGRVARIAGAGVGLIAAAKILKKKGNPAIKNPVTNTNSIQFHPAKPAKSTAKPQQPKTRESQKKSFPQIPDPWD
jgi:hypothetical protein